MGVWEWKAPCFQSVTEFSKGHMPGKNYITIELAYIRLKILLIIVQNCIYFVYNT